GGKLTTRLAALGITTALDLADANPKQLRKHFSVVMEKTISELNGESCLELEMEAPTKQQILCSRSFGEVVTDKHIMQQLVSGYIARAAEKLRFERQCCGHVQVFIRTSFFRQGTVQYSNAASTRFPVKTDDTRVLTRAALSLLDVIWKDGVRYAKAGVMLTELGDQCVWCSRICLTPANLTAARNSWHCLTALTPALTAKPGLPVRGNSRRGP
ncbi:MAG: hypothetical protein Q8K17_03635, partial [Pseudohongiella sp.]|nr:hypothetical protein [Pseudohongiella sp.]